jgi:hypothetical protein
VLLVLQAMDAAGKDGTIRNMLPGSTRPASTSAASVCRAGPRRSTTTCGGCTAAVPAEGPSASSTAATTRTCLVVRVKNFVPEVGLVEALRAHSPLRAVARRRGHHGGEVLPQRVEGRTARAAAGARRRPGEALEVPPGDLDDRKLWDEVPAGVRGGDRRAPPPLLRRGTWCPPTATGCATWPWRRSCCATSRSSTRSLPRPEDGIEGLSSSCERASCFGSRRLTKCKVAHHVRDRPSLVERRARPLAADPSATLLAGGTDLMVELNSGHRRRCPRRGVALNRVRELRSWRHDPAATRLLHRRRRHVRGDRRRAARSLGAGAGRGGAHGRVAADPPRRHHRRQPRHLLAGRRRAARARGARRDRVHLASADGARDVPFAEFMVGVKRTARLPGELITGVTVPVLDGWQGYSKVGVRNAMVIATASACARDRHRAARCASRSVRSAP